MTATQALLYKPICPLGELDAETAPVALDLANAFARGRCVVLDLAGVTFIDAGGLGAIVALRNDLIATGRDLRLVNVQPRQAFVFHLGGLESLL